MGAASSRSAVRVAPGMLLREVSDRRRWAKLIIFRIDFWRSLFARLLRPAATSCSASCSFARAAVTPASRNFFPRPRSCAASTFATSRSSRQSIDSKVAARRPHPDGSVVVVVIVVVVVTETVVVVVTTAVVVVVLGGGGKAAPPLWTMVLAGSPRKVATKKSLERGSNSRPHGPTPRPEAKRASTGLVVPSVGWPVPLSTGRPVAGSMVRSRTSPKFQLTYIRLPASGPDGTYWMAPVPCCGRGTKTGTVPGAKMAPPL